MTEAGLPFKMQTISPVIQLFLATFVMLLDFKQVNNEKIKLDS